MNDFDRLAKRLNIDVTKLFLQSVEKFGAEIAELNREQLLKGKRADSQDIKPDYAEGYKKVRKRKGLQVGHVDLKFTGKYHKSYKVSIKNERAYVGSDYHTDGGKYKFNIEGLTVENEKKILDKIIPEFKRLVSNEIR